ncbi:hypothetical protein HDV00_004878 [Rhizophlyctis rosea]|nr:hypothetical protein HDV00_004878 [Rhizophlyctis rosea]
MSAEPTIQWPGLTGTTTSAEPTGQSPILTELSMFLREHLGVSTFPAAISHVWGETRPQSLAGTTVPLSDDPPKIAVINELLSSTSAWLDVLQLKGLSDARLGVVMRNMHTTYVESITFVVHSSAEEAYYKALVEEDEREDFDAGNVAFLGGEYLKTAHATRVWTFQEVLLPKIVIHVVPKVGEAASVSISRGLRLYTRAAQALRDAAGLGCRIETTTGPGQDPYGVIELSWNILSVVGWFTGPKTAWAIFEGVALNSVPPSLRLGDLIDYARDAGTEIDVSGQKVGGRSCREIHDRIYGVAAVVGYTGFHGYNCSLELLLEDFLNAVGDHIEIALRPRPWSDHGPTYLGTGVDIEEFVKAVSDSIYGPG